MDPAFLIMPMRHFHLLLDPHEPVMVHGEGMQWTESENSTVVLRPDSTSDQLQFSLMDPMLDEESATLLDLAITKSLSRYRPDPGGGPCPL